MEADLYKQRGRGAPATWKPRGMAGDVYNKWGLDGGVYNKWGLAGDVYNKEDAIRGDLDSGEGWAGESPGGCMGARDWSIEGGTVQGIKDGSARWDW